MNSRKISVFLKQINRWKGSSKQVFAPYISYRFLDLIFRKMSPLFRAIHHWNKQDYRQNAAVVTYFRLNIYWKLRLKINLEKFRIKIAPSPSSFNILSRGYSRSFKAAAWHLTTFAISHALIFASKPTYIWALAWSPSLLGGSLPQFCANLFHVEFNTDLLPYFLVILYFPPFGPCISLLGLP